MSNHLLSHRRDLCQVAANTNHTLDEFVASKKCSSARLKDIIRRIAEMVAKDLRPISTVHGYGFQNLMSYVELGYTVPSLPHTLLLCVSISTRLKRRS